VRLSLRGSGLAKRCYFTADNFFHQDTFSGSGGWMGLNRSSPPMYAASAQKVLDAAPEWVVAEHGGPFEFSAEDFRRVH
jgi:glyoxylase-like metal-dependent hydrolase (beta-lactamase superfamily II)